jgi:trimeric autotransporter adhesin
MKVSGWRRGALVVAAVTTTLAGALVARPAEAVVSSDVPNDQAWVTNGRVDDIVRVGDDVYLAGRFTNLGPHTGHAVLTDTTTGDLVPGIPSVNGTVYDAVSDGAGGWYIVGSFDNVAGVPRGRGAHVLADGTLADWNPIANGTIRQIEWLGTELVIGGDFNKIRSNPRTNLAVVDTVAGSPRWNWIADTNGSVNAVVVAPSGLRVFVAGAFTSLDGAPRSRVGSVTAATGAVETFSPVVNNVVNAVAISPTGQDVYLGGSFTNVGGLIRNRLAAVDAQTGAVRAVWQANVNGVVNTLAINPNGTLFFGGAFTGVKSADRKNAASVTASAAVTNWNPAPTAALYTIELTSDFSGAWLGGQFASVKGVTRQRAALVNLSTGNVLGSYNPRASSHVRVIKPSDGGVLLGGDFTSVGIVARRYLARVDAATGVLDTSFAPNLNASAEALAVNDAGTVLYVGGSFTNANGSQRNHAAAYSIPGGGLTSWNPNVSNVVHALDYAGGKVAIGGAFGVVKGLLIKNLARVDDGTGTPDAGFTPNPNAPVWDVDIMSDGSVYVAGDFTTVGPLLQTRNYLAEIAPTGAPTSWNPNPPSNVLEGTLNDAGTRYYAALRGKGTQGNAVDAYTTTSPGSRLWRVQGTGDVQAIELSPDETTVYAGGHFFEIVQGATNVIRFRLMAVNASDGALHSWTPRLDLAGKGVWAIDAADDALHVGGEFTRIGPVSSQGIAHFNSPP